MKFKISKREFAKHITQVLKGIPTKNDKPILKNFFIEANQESGEVFVTSTDSIVAIQSKTSASVEENGSFCVDAKLLDGLLKKVKLKAKQDIDLVFYVEGNELIVEIDSSLTKLKTADVKEYPKIKWSDGETTFIIDGDSFMESIKQVSFSTLKNESRPILSGVLFKAEKEYLTMVSTDGHRMSLKLIQIEGTLEEKEVLVPVDSLTGVGKILASNKKSKMNVMISEKEAIFETNGIKVMTSFIPGEFLNYKRIFGMKQITRVMLDKESILSLLERALIFIPKDKIALVTFEGEDDLLAIKIDSESGNIEETLESNMIGENFKITFNVSYMIAVLQKIKEDRVSLNLSTSTSPVILEGVGNKSYKHMLLPVKSSN